LLDRVVDAIAVSAGDDVRVVHWSERLQDLQRNDNKAETYQYRSASAAATQPDPAYVCATHADALQGSTASTARACACIARAPILESDACSYDTRPDVARS
jgi:hypothetical protein